MFLFLEFAVQMKCQSCAEKIHTILSNTAGIKDVEVSFDKGIVLVESNIPSLEVKETLEKAGYVAVLNGYGTKSNTELARKSNGNTAVAMLGGLVGYSTCNANVKGVIHFVQNVNTCVIDGTIDGLSPGLHGLHIHECGDISSGCDSVGDHFDLNGINRHGGPDDDYKNRHTGDLGNIEADENGRAIFLKEDNIINVSDIIGRSVVVTENQDDLGKGGHPLSLVNGNSGIRLSCGIISRAAGLFQNAKRICACDGVTIWDERNKPLAGPGRRSYVTDEQKSGQP